MPKLNPILLSLSNISNSVKFALIAALCGGSAGFARFIISDIVQKKVRWEDPIHMSLTPTIYLGIPSFIAGAALAYFIVKIIIGENYLSRNIFIWIFVGILYGVFLPFVTGLLLPMGMFFMNLSLGIIESHKAFFFFIDAILLAPTNAFTHGIFGVVCGLLCGGCLTLSLWAIDRLQTIGTKWQLGLGVAFSLTMISFSKLSPAPFLVNFG